MSLLHELYELDFLMMAKQILSNPHGEKTKTK